MCSSDGTIVHDTFDTRTCTTDNHTLLTYNQAWFIEGLSVMANVTKNDTLTALYVYRLRLCAA